MSINVFFSNAVEQAKTVLLSDNLSYVVFKCYFNKSKKTWVIVRHTHVGTTGGQTDGRTDW